MFRRIRTAERRSRAHIFEMPLLGYAGYLPFGLECLVIGDLVRRWMTRVTAGR